MVFDQTKWVWMNGQLVRWRDATVNVSAHALHYGSGVFEGVRCYATEDGPAVFRLEAHLDRLFASAEVYGIKVPYSREELTAAVCEVIRLNGFESCYVRPICFFGSGVARGFSKLTGVTSFVVANSGKPSQVRAITNCRFVAVLR